MSGAARRKPEFDEEEDKYILANACPEMSETELHDACGRWQNGHLGQYCMLAGTEFCDWDCPHQQSGK